MPTVQLMSSASSGLGSLATNPPEALLTSSNTTASLIVTPSSGTRTVRIQQYVAGTWIDVQGGTVAVDFAVSNLAKSVLVSINSAAGALRAVSATGTGGVSVIIEAGYGLGPGDDAYTPDNDELWTGLAGSIPETQREAIDALLTLIYGLGAGSGALVVWDYWEVFSLVTAQTDYVWGAGTQRAGDISAGARTDAASALVQWGVTILIPNLDYVILADRIQLISSPSAEQSAAGQPLSVRVRAA